MPHHHDVWFTGKHKQQHNSYRVRPHIKNIAARQSKVELHKISCKHQSQSQTGQMQITSPVKVRTVRLHEMGTKVHRSEDQILQNKTTLAQKKGRKE